MNVSAAAEVMDVFSLDSEWQRMRVLAECLLETKLNREPSQALVKQLADIQTQVESLRNTRAPWRVLIGADDLPELALDILAAVYAPLFNPEAALLYQDLQQSKTVETSFLFLYRLLALQHQEYQRAMQMLLPEGVLIKRRLLVVTGQGSQMQIQAHPNITRQLLGQPASLSVPGAVQITMQVTWDDLIIAASQRRILHEFLLWTRHQQQVVQEWSGRQAGGPIALFSGPSGTGKTFAAAVIAAQLGYQLYRVDLGALISKYIGETEKNLNALFDSVQEQHVLLQFDEVDALMGKRGDIKDARDRYANMEVSHLLSRIEQHRGPCILTTNLRKQIDQAFQRRFHFVVSFPRPEVKERELLWQRLLPSRAPISSEVDLSVVAQAVALTGGEIRNAAMHAAVLAAAESTSIDLSHIAVGVWRVLQKADGQNRINQLRQLAKHLPDYIAQGEAHV